MAIPVPQEDGAGAEPLLAAFDYHLPADRIAQRPARPRDASRLMVLDRAAGTLAHHRFSELPDLLRPADLLVLNDTRVIPAALTARRASGSRIEGCFLRAMDDGTWEVLLAGRGRLKAGERLAVVDAADRACAGLELLARGEGGVWRVRPDEGTDVMDLLSRVGRPPLPPYIRRQASGDARTDSDRQDYQTVYARRNGAVAAPTAGLHFTERLFERLAERGVRREFITLHVGLGTFQPIRAERLAEHRMHAEYLEISDAAAAHISEAKAAGNRVVAVGTTTVRALESAVGADGRIRPGGRWTDLFIRPPYTFRAVDALITNFHLPRTTLLVMVCAFAGRQRILAAYREAVEAGYRFYSYGDAMLIV